MQHCIQFNSFIYIYVFAVIQLFSAGFFKFIFYVFIVYFYLFGLVICKWIWIVNWLLLWLLTQVHSGRVWAIATFKASLLSYSFSSSFYVHCHSAELLQFNHNVTIWSTSIDHVHWWYWCYCEAMQFTVIKRQQAALCVRLFIWSLVKCALAGCEHNSEPFLVSTLFLHGLVGFNFFSLPGCLQLHDAVLLPTTRWCCLAANN